MEITQLKEAIQRKIADQSDVLIKNTILELLLNLVEQFESNSGDNGTDPTTPVENIVLIYKLESAPILGDFGVSTYKPAHYVQLSTSDIITLLDNTNAPTFTRISKTSNTVAGHNHVVTFVYDIGNSNIKVEEISNNSEDNHICTLVHNGIIVDTKYPLNIIHNQLNPAIGDYPDEGYIVYQPNKDNVPGNFIGGGDFYGWVGDRFVQLNRDYSVANITDIKRYLNTNGDYWSRIIFTHNPNRTLEERTNNTKFEVYYDPQNGSPGYWSQYSINGFEFKGELPFILEPGTLVRFVTYDGSYKPSNVYQIPFSNISLPGQNITNDLVVNTLENITTITFTLPTDLFTGLSIEDVKEHIYLKGNAVTPEQGSYDVFIDLKDAEIERQGASIKVRKTINNESLFNPVFFKYESFSVHDALARYNSSQI